MSKPSDYKTIIYATDLGTHTRPVFRHAVDLAKKCGAKIIMTHAVKPLGATGRAVISTYLPELDIGGMEHDGMEKVIDGMRKRLERFCQEEGDAYDDSSDLVSDISITAGNPPEVILETASEYNGDLIIMGSCTHTLFRHHSLGSTARKVTQHSTIPVLVVPNAEI